MSDVVSFRPTEEEAEIIERTKRRILAKSRGEAVRWLVRKGAERSGSLADSPVFRFRVPKRYRLKRSLSSRELDDILYGGESR